MGSALLLEAAENRPLQLIARTEVVQEAPGELLAVELRKHVLVADVRKQLDDFVQLLLYLLLAQLV